VFTNLSLQQNPPFSVPARFFITAPLFDIGAALIFLFYGSGMLVSRWSPGMLAATHALVLGFFATVMLGALQQILPVVVGVSICHPKRVASIVHLLWVIGITLLIGVFSMASEQSVLYRGDCTWLRYRDICRNHTHELAAGTYPQ